MQNCPKFILRQFININRPLVNNLFRRSMYKLNFVPVICSLSTMYLSRYKYCTTEDISVTLKLRKSPVSTINDLGKYINEERQFYLKLLINILDSIDFEIISSDDAILILECCGSFTADSCRELRNKTCQEIYRNLMKHDKLNQSISDTYIKVCTENNVVLNCKEFLNALNFEPTRKTYKILLENVCERGNIEQAFEILEVMKNRSIAADEDVFNNLVLAHTIRGGLKAGQSVLLTMRTAQVPETTNTKFSLLKGVLQGNSNEDLKTVLSQYPVYPTETQFLELLGILGLSTHIAWLEEIKNIYTHTITREFINALQKICVHLVHMDKSESAILLYEQFVDPGTDENYGFFILKEMLHCNVNAERIISITKHLQENLNKYALQNLTEISLRHNYVDTSWKLLENFTHLRPHYFWPLLLNAKNKEGEMGIFNVLKKINKMDVKIDSETLQFYVLPFCDLDNCKLLMKKFQDLGLSVKEVLSAIVAVLLQNNKVKQAAEICTNYCDVQIFGDNLFKLITSSWKTSKDTSSVVYLLQRYCESNETENDLVGDFLFATINSCETSHDFQQYLLLLKIIQERRLRISSASIDILHDSCSMRCTSSDLEKIKDHIGKLIDFGLKHEPVFITHPRNMNLEELECHLIELQEKNMETRGILRRLIQLHSGLGNIDRVKELRQQFISTGYEETIGMKSSLMHNYIKEGHLEGALNTYNEIKNASPQFKLDDFKIIDLATLLIKESRFEETMNIMKNEASSKKPIQPSSIERNCWRLLGSFQNEDEQLEMFKFLIENKYCKPTNVILGPLVRIHLNRADLQKAAKVYLNCAKIYKCTPLQLEIIKAIVKTENEVLLQEVLNATVSIHGSVPTQTALITALSENGQEKPLKKLLANNKLHIKKELEKRCHRWIQEEKVDALQTLANACERLPAEVFDVNVIFSCLLQIYSLKSDYKAAVEFYEQLLEKEVFISKKLENELDKLLRSCNFEMKKNI